MLADLRIYSGVQQGIANTALKHDCLVAAAWLCARHPIKLQQHSISLLLGRHMPKIASSGMVGCESLISQLLFGITSLPERRRAFMWR